MDQYYAPIGNTLVPYADLTPAQISACTEYYYVSEAYWADYIKFSEEPEKFIAQTNWAYDSGEYGWRITEATALKFDRVSLTLQNNIKINFLVSKELVNNSGYENLYAVFEMDGMADNTVSTFTDNGSYYVFSYSNISPDRMNDTIRATLYGTRGDKQYVCIRMDYSIAEYCYTVLSDSTQPAKLRTLLVDLLNYGAASQIYTGHNTANLVNASLTATQLGWGTTDPVALTSVTNSPNGQLTDPEVRWKAVGLSLGNSITMQFVFSAADTDGLTIKIKDAPDGNVVKEYTASSFTPSGTYHRIFFNDLTVGQMSDTFYVTAYRADTAVSGTLTYSVESYACAKQNDADANLASLVVAMMKYGKSAYAFSHN